MIFTKHDTLIHPVKETSIRLYTSMIAAGKMLCMGAKRDRQNQTAKQWRWPRYIILYTFIYMLNFSHLAYRNAGQSLMLFVRHCISLIAFCAVCVSFILCVCTFFRNIFGRRGRGCWSLFFVIRNDCIVFWKRFIYSSNDETIIVSLVLAFRDCSFSEHTSWSSAYIPKMRSFI